MDVESFQKNLNTKIIGKNVHYFKEIKSTNDYAKKLGNKGASEGTIVISESQTMGKGRLNRNWKSPIGGIYLSIILRPSIKPSSASVLNLITAIAVTKVLQKYNISAKIKWPNDVLINKKKICGILTEMSSEHDEIKYVVVGIGLNTNTEIKSFDIDLQTTSTSIKNEINKEISNTEIIKILIEEFEKIYREFIEYGFTKLKEEWKFYSSTIGNIVKFITKNNVIEGKAIDIQDDGALLIETKNGFQKMISGDCIHLNH